MRHICVVTNSRADYSRLKTLLFALQREDGIRLSVVAMGSHMLSEYGRTVDEIEKDGFNVSYKIYTEIDGRLPVTMSKSVGVAIIDLTTVFDNLRPDIVVVHGDRFEAIAVTVAASMMNIHVAHLQGGEVTGSIDEHIRHAITKLSHFHFPSSDIARDRILKLGEDPDHVFNLGCPSCDLLLGVVSSTFEELKKEVIKYTKKSHWVENFNKDFFLFMYHPVTTEFKDIEKDFSEVLDALRKFDNPILILWPNIDAGSEKVVDMIKRFERDQNGRVGVFKHFPADVFVDIMRHARVMIGNSSAGVREACYFGTPVVNIGSRQNGRERSKNVLDVGYNSHDIENAIKSQLVHGRYEAEYLYGDGTSGEKIAKILASIPIDKIQKKITY